MNSAISDVANAIPLKNPATPIPSGTHIFSKRDAMKSIKDNTGIDALNAFLQSNEKFLWQTVLGECKSETMYVDWK